MSITASFPIPKSIIQSEARKEIVKELSKLPEFNNGREFNYGPVLNKKSRDTKLFIDGELQMNIFGDQIQVLVPLRYEGNECTFMVFGGWKWDHGRVVSLRGMAELTISYAIQGVGGPFRNVHLSFSGKGSIKDVQRYITLPFELFTGPFVDQILKQLQTINIQLPKIPTLQADKVVPPELLDAHVQELRIQQESDQVVITVTAAL